MMNEFIFENQIYIDEVLEFLDAGSLFVQKQFECNEFVVITELSAAETYAFSQDEDDVDIVWADLISHQRSEINKTLYKLPDYKTFSANLDKIQLYRYVSRSKNKFVTEYSDYIEGDFEGVLRARALVGKQNKFFEQQLLAYQMGGWPCGWSGNYPDGKMIVYLPSNAGNLDECLSQSDNGT